MSAVNEQFLAAYDAQRLSDQRDYYDRRAKEYRRSARQLNTVNVSLLALASICGVAGATWSDLAVEFGLAAAGLSAVAAAVTAWADVIGFAPNAELYEATSGSLFNLSAQQPRNRSAATDEEVAVYVRTIEGQLMGEVRAWRERWGEQAEQLGRVETPWPAPEPDANAADE